MERLLNGMPEWQKNLTENIILTVYNLALEIGTDNLEEEIIGWLENIEERDKCFSAYPAIKKRYYEKVGCSEEKEA